MQTYIIYLLFVVLSLKISASCLLIDWPKLATKSEIFHDKIWLRKLLTVFDLEISWKLKNIFTLNGNKHDFFWIIITIHKWQVNQISLDWLPFRKKLTKQKFVDKLKQGVAFMMCFHLRITLHIQSLTYLKKIQQKIQRIKISIRRSKAILNYKKNIWKKESCKKIKKETNYRD